MKPASFNYHRPQTVEAAISLLARYGASAKPIAGGQSLGPMLNMRLARPEHLVDLNDLVELDFLRASGEVLEIGAMTRHSRIATAPEVRRAHPLLAAAAATIGHYPIRQRGTIGGSLVHADPAAQIPLIATLCDAEIIVSGMAGTRAVSASEFFQAVMTVDLRHGEMLTAARFPVLAAATGWGFRLFSRRRGDFAIVAVAATLSLDGDGRFATVDIAVGGVDSVPLRIDLSGAAIKGEMPTESRVSDMAAFVADRISPDDGATIPAEYRRKLAAELTRQALNEALERTRGVAS